MIIIGWLNECARNRQIGRKSGIGSVNENMRENNLARES